MTLPSRAAVEAALAIPDARWSAALMSEELLAAVRTLRDALHDFPGGAPQAGDDVQTSRRKESSGAKDLRADAPTGRPLAGDSECAVLKPCGLVETDDAASPASVRGEISEEERLLDEALARPNDWPLDDDNVGFWIPRSALLKLRAILRESRREEGR